MARNAETQVMIPASHDAVWQKLSDLPAYAAWNSRTHFDRPPVVGRRQRMRVKLFGLWMRVPVTIESCDPTHGLRWRGGLPGLYTGSHYFRIESAGPGSCRFIQGEDFNGILVPALWPLLKGELQSLYEGMNRELREQFTD